ncbi:MAG: chromosome segregation protein SMC [Coriobacteriales bacterium]|nr:chromosome segregation protein SMC [Coriobacteriales bacterium]
MYLKSLTLKGFKSFADKTTMVFDPGLNVVVGPNGSGKSNISDSILWVLGEQSAKMLRGQAMEDVIFSGSSARQPVNVAEVTLVFDNSDHKLPVDFTELAITRRMYRSGESEYLINGAPSRLLDITDILHDSGMGKDTHSIISQGKLDSVLASRPEQRRELIEEAAGISKHRRRKERSERKLKSMDENLHRAKDIAREINRQLRPLERQVNKAKRAHELQGQIRELRLTLAVDDLRGLQQRHQQLSTRQREAEAACQIAQVQLQQKSDELERYQVLLEQKGLFVGNLDEERKRTAGMLSSIDADLRVLGQKGSSMRSRANDLQQALQAAEREGQQVRQEHAQVRSDLEAARAEWDQLKRQCDQLGPAAREARDRRKQLGSRLGRMQSDQQAAQRKADQEMLAYAKLRDQIENAQTQDGLYQSRLDQINESVAVAQERIRDREAHRDEVSAQLEQAQAAADAAKQAIRQLQDQVQTCRRQESQARETLARERAQLSALESVDAQAAKSSPLVASLTKRNDVRSLVRSRLADVVEAPSDLEEVVERLLGDDLQALLVSDDAAAKQVAEAALGQRNASGQATVLSLDAAPATTADAPGRDLLGLLKVPDEALPLATRLFGRVRVVDSVEDGLRARHEAPDHTYVTLSGVIFLPDGRIHVGQQSNAEHGALERKRRIRQLRQGLDDREAAYAKAQEQTAQAEKDLSQKRDADAASRGELARLRGELSSATSEIGRLQGQLSKAQAQRTQVERERDAARAKAAQAREEVARHRKASQEAQEHATDLQHQLESLQGERSEASRAESQADERLSQAKVQLAAVTERKNHLITRDDQLTSREAQLAKSAADPVQLDELRVRLRRVEPLRQSYERVRDALRQVDALLGDRARLAQADSASLRQTIAQAKQEVSQRSQEVEKSRTAASDAKVAIGRIEVQVENAVSDIEALGEPLEQALQTEAPKDRAASEAQLSRLDGELKGIGPVNEVAMEQYTRLKRRADYINEQVADLESARKSLTKINAAIDRKMRRQFLVVFDQVNANFQEIFAMLFPGGQAHIEMTDPDDPAQTGIEIVAQPRGKKITKMMLMSGGEKSLTALALLFAVYKTRTVPFYVFDEVEAALDYANLQKLLNAIELLKRDTQLIVISHQRRTMEQADVLYGVSMQADGVSHVVSQRLDKSGKVVDA